MGGSAGAPAGWPGEAAPIVVAASARVGLLLTQAVYGRCRPGPVVPARPDRIADPE